MKLNQISTALITLAAAAVMSTCASAQVLNTPTTSVQNPLSVKIGVLFPGSHNSTRYGGADQLSIGVDYALAKTTDENPSLPSVYFDYSGGQQHSGHIDSFGIGGAVRSLTNSATSKFAPYVGAGAGVYYTSASKADNTKTNFGVGAKIFAGVDVGGGFFLEGNYQFLPSADGVNPSGFGLQAGMRF